MLAAHGHFGRAAEALGITQPALTRSIQNLERSLGVKLFDRQRGHVEPTPMGYVLIERGKRILSESDELLRQLHSVRDLEIGHLTVSAGLYPAELSAHRAVGRLIQEHPGIHCQVKLCDWRRALVDICNRKADIALAELSEAECEPPLVTQLVGSHPMAFFARPKHPLATSKRLSLERIFAFPLAGTRGPARLTQHLPKNLGAAGWIDKSNGDFVPAIQVDSVTAAVQVAVESNVVCVAPIDLMERERKNGSLVELSLRKSWLHLNYGFIYLRDRTLLPTAKAFMKAVEAVETSRDFHI